jgi:hypothetical protein
MQDDLIDRATAAWFRSEPLSDQPDQSLSDVYSLDGRTYVVLENIRGPLAVYRLKNDGRLRRLKRWPKALE